MRNYVDSLPARGGVFFRDGGTRAAYGTEVSAIRDMSV
jgi:hypothetical protein